MKILLFIIEGVIIFVLSFLSIRLWSHNTAYYDFFNTKYDILCNVLQVVCLILVFSPFLLAFKDPSKVDVLGIMSIIYVVVYGTGMVIGDWFWCNNY